MSANLEQAKQAISEAISNAYTAQENLATGENPQFRATYQQLDKAINMLTSSMVAVELAIKARAAKI